MHTVLELQKAPMIESFGFVHIGLLKERAAQNSRVNGESMELASTPENMAGHHRLCFPDHVHSTRNV